MKRAVYPGTFDPVTNGHMDLVQRGLRIFDEIIIAVARSSKKGTFFTLDERVSMLRESVKEFTNVTVEPFDTLLVDYVATKDAVAIIRGLRAVSDFEYEMQMALMNRKLEHNVETVFMMPSLRYIFLSSTIVKEAASFGGVVDGLVPPHVERALKEKCKER